MGGQDVRDRYGWASDLTTLAAPNIVKANVDALTTRTIADQPPLTVAAAGARWEDQFAVEEFESAMDAIFNTEANSRELSLGGRAPLLAGIRWARPVYRAGEIKIQSLRPWQVIYDPVEGRARDLHTIHLVEYRDRGDLLHLLDAWDLDKSKRKAKQVRAMSPLRSTQESDGWSLYDRELEHADVIDDADRLRVVHSWRVASYDGRKDGRYVMRCSGADGATVVAINRHFERTTLPVVPIVLQPGMEGLTGIGSGHQSLPYQMQIDLSMGKNQRALEKYGHLRLVVPVADDAAVRAWKTAGVTVHVANGLPEPKFLDPQTLRPEDAEHAREMMALAESVQGINSAMSRGTTDLGANASGAAQREEYARTNDRFVDQVANWHAARVRLATETMHLLDDVLQVDREFAADYEYLGRRQRVPWADLCRTRDRCKISIEARGAAAISRGGRTARIQEWAAQGLIAQDLAREALLSSPDAKSTARIALAPIRLVEWQLRAVIEARDGDWSHARPDNDTPLDIALARARATIQRATVEGAEYETLERLREYQLQCQELLRAAAPPAPPPAMPGAAPAGAML